MTLSVTCEPLIAASSHGMKHAHAVGDTMNAVAPTSSGSLFHVMLALIATVYGNESIVKMYSVVLRFTIAHMEQRFSGFLQHVLARAGIRRDATKLAAEIVNAPKPRHVPHMVKCDVYGCKNHKEAGSVFCHECYEDYLDDPNS
jgi:hypothetical protein